MTTGDAGRRPLVLVVDDYEDNREMYAEYLRYCGFEVDTAVTGVEAIDKVHTRVPDIIVMDLTMPALDGWAATRRLKADPRTREIPVMALTGHALDGSEAAARAAGCDGYV